MIINLLLQSRTVVGRDNRTNLYFDETKIEGIQEYQEGSKIELLKYLKGKQVVDLPVQIGSKKRLKMRLIAKKLPKKQAKKKIEEAKKARHSKTKHSANYFELLKWEIYLTNVTKDKLSINDIAQLYGLRWYIEILFKSWKSYCNFKTMLNRERMPYHRTLICIYLLLIQFVYVMLDIFKYIEEQVAKRNESFISILKFMDLVHDLFDKLINIQSLKDLDKFIPQFAVHAVYEKRKKRKNMIEKICYFKHLN